MPISGRIPIAVSTGDNSTRPEWQAEPVEGRDAVEPRQDVRADMVRESDIQRVRQAILGVTVEHDATCEVRARPARSLGNN